MTRVWLIDDKINQSQAVHLLNPNCEEIEIKTNTPEDDDFIDSLNQPWDLILVDEELWPDESDRAPPAAMDGASLVASLRAWARMKGQLLPPVAILTSHETAFGNEPPARGASRPVIPSFRGHESMVSPVIDVDTLLSKHDIKLSAKVIDLARSHESAKNVFGKGGITLEELARFLGMCVLEGQEPFHLSRLIEARPPINEENANEEFPARGPAIAVRWLLNRALPFPGLFISELYVAQALGIEPETVADVLNEANKKCDALRKCIYTGPLSKLSPRRFWSGAVDLFVAQLPDDPALKAKELGVREESLLPVESIKVVVVNETLDEAGLVDVSQAVRVNPKGWPSEAFQPWMTTEKAKSKPWLQTWVDKVDRSRLDD